METEREDGGGEEQKPACQFLMEIDEITTEKSWSSLRTGYLKKEPEGCW